ncbi:MAG: rhodanese-like domain-containing protein [Flavobacteriales bacterium]|nr:rhodanese-like domain-containing protein [Flavobacteriales bacterium]
MLLRCQLPRQPLLPMKEIKPEELQAWRTRAHRISSSMCANRTKLSSAASEANIPMGEVVDRVGELRRDIPVVLHCRSGARSVAVI